MSTKIYFEEYGDPQVLRVGPEELPEPDAGQVRVEFRAVGVNPLDCRCPQSSSLLCLRGSTSSRPPAFRWPVAPPIQP